jgi:hypothetical protein
LSAPPIPSLAPSARGQHASRCAKVGILSPFPPTRGGLATFSAALSEALAAHGTDVSVVRVADGSPASRKVVIGELVNGSARSTAVCADLLNQNDVAVIQHDYGIYGSAEGYDVVDVIRGLTVPSIVVTHTIPKDPTPQQRSVLESIAAVAGQLVVMSEVANIGCVRITASNAA